MKQTGFTLIELMTLIFIIFLLAYWPMNLQRFTNCDFESPYTCEFFHALGLIPVFSPFVVWVGDDAE